MTAKIPVTVIYKGEGFRQIERDAVSLDRDLKRQSQERLRMMRLQERANKAVTQELKEQIRDQQRLNRLTEKLNRDLEKQQQARQQRMGQAAGIAGIAIGAGAAFAVDAIRAAEAAQTTEKSFVGLSGGLEQAQRNMQAMRRATRDLVTEQQQQAIANQLLGMNVAQTDQELEKVVGVSRRLGKEFRGLGAADAANEFALMISNMSVARLDSFGISSGNVRKRIDELMKSTQGMTREQAFFQATMEEADKVLQRLGPETETNAEKVERLGARFGDLKVGIGELLLAMGEAGGIIDGLTGLMEEMAKGAESWKFVIEQGKLLNQALNETKETGNETIDTFNSWADTAKIATAATNPLGFAFDWVIQKGAQLATNTDEVGQRYNELAQQAEAAKQSQANVAAATEDATAAAEDNAVALEEQAKRLKEIADARQKFARDLISIDEKAQQETDKAWQDYWDKEANAWQDHTAKIADIKRKSGEDVAKIDRDLQRDLEKLNKDSARDLAKINKDEGKQIADLQRRAAQETKQEQRRKQIDAMADERLFNFEMRQLAAEGNAAQIQEALERRKIEQEIAKEKATAEAQIEDDKLQQDIQRVREAAEERRSELRADTQERAAQLQQQAEDEKVARQERLQQELQDEQANYQQRLEELRKNREERLAEIETGKQQAIEALGRELAEAQDLTREQLAALTPVAGQLGESAGKSFAEGLNKGFQTNSRIKEMLGETEGTDRSSLAQSFGFSAGRGGSRGRPRRFQHGGEFTVGGAGGPDSQLVQFLATPGERVTVTPPGQPAGGGQTINLTLNAQGPGIEQLAAIMQRKINEGLQEYTDTVLGPALS